MTEPPPLPKRGSPEREANRISKLWKLRPGPRFPVDVREIALTYSQTFSCVDKIMDVKGGAFSRFDGALLFNADKPTKKEWGIVFNENATHGRQRFTISHELGHFVLHRQMQKVFECGQDEVCTSAGEETDIEAEADKFASYLLMPADDVRAQIDPRDLSITFDQLSTLADRYGVSLQAVMLKWLELTERRALVVVLMDDHMLWARSSQNAFKSGLWFRTRNGPPVPIPPASLAANAEVAREEVGKTIDARIWFPQEPAGMSLREMKISADNHRQIMSLLVLPDGEPRYAQPQEEEPRDYDTLDRFEQNGQPLIRYPR